MFAAIFTLSSLFAPQDVSLDDLSRFPDAEHCSSQTAWCNHHKEWLTAQAAIFNGYGQGAYWQQRVDRNEQLRDVWLTLSLAHRDRGWDLAWPKGKYNESCKDKLRLLKRMIGDDAYRLGVMPCTGDAEYFAP